MAKLDLRNPGRPIHVGVILANGMTEILDVAPVDILHGLNRKFVSRLFFLPENLRDQALDFEFHWVTENGTDAELTGGAFVKATDSFESCPPLDIVLMGAHWSEGSPVGIQTEAELAFVRKAYEDCTAYISICAGMMIPLVAGVLEGKTCTGPRPILGMLRQQHPGANWVDKRWYKDADGKTWTSGALLNGTDLMHAFVSETWGGSGTLAELALRDGGWPSRDVDYADL